jgi:pyrroloquinoline quinone (PQQ) biosynthesis protein C
MNNHLEQLVSDITRHPALDNHFYRLWAESTLPIEALEVFARNYGAWTKAFPDSLAVLVASTGNLKAKAEYVKTLYSEMGYGNHEKSHSVLLDNFLVALADKLGQERRLDRQRLEEEFELLPATRAFIDGQKELYGRDLQSVGAQLALEWQAYTMLRKLYDGARNYMSLWSDPDEFHEACEYFYVHIGEAEKEHKLESLSAAKEYASDDTSLAQIVAGYERHLNLLADFWESLHRAMSAFPAARLS